MSRRPATGKDFHCLKGAGTKREVVYTFQYTPVHAECVAQIKALPCSLDYFWAARQGF